MEETTFFQNDGVRVTNARFVVDGQTFALSNITSVKTSQKSPGRLWPILLVIVGGLMAISTGQYAWLILLLAGGGWLVLQKTMYHVLLHTAGGETSALRSYQKEYVESVVTALNNAIVHRG